MIHGADYNRFLPYPCRRGRRSSKKKKHFQVEDVLSSLTSCMCGSRTIAQKTPSLFLLVYLGQLSGHNGYSHFLSLRSQSVH